MAKRARVEADQGYEAALEAWWADVRKLGKDAYEAGKVLDLSAPVELKEARGPDQNIKRLFVRRDFDSLYRSIQARKGQNWLVHLNGNSGIGKSAFLWYFVIRYAIDMGKRPFLLVYQSGNFAWIFDSNGKVDLIKKSNLPFTTLKRACWHLVNQKIEPEDSLGGKVLVAASPNPENVKNARRDRQFTTVYMYPWDRDEFDALNKLWEEEASWLEKEASQLENVDQGTSERHRCSLQDDIMEEEFERTYETDLVTMKDMARTIRGRIQAADTYYSWFGGVPRMLWQLVPDDLITDAQLESLVDTLLATTNLAKVYQATCTDDVTWPLLQFRRPQTAGCKYLLDFPSSKIKYKFAAGLATAKRDDLRPLLDSSDPQLGALRGFLFEQKVVAKVFHSTISASLMVGDKHCGKCISRDDKGQGVVDWIACGVCKAWYHQRCVLREGELPPLKWDCKSCERNQVLLRTPTRRLRLRYYGDLKEALLKAGADAVNYVWRPLRKNNGGYDFVILPATLGQATKAQCHPVPFEAIKEGLAALEAWNKVYNKEAYPKRFLLSFFLSQDNYPRFSYQSYRNKQRRVTSKGVRGIAQAKVLIRAYHDEQLEQCADIPDPEDAVEELDDLAFEPMDFQAMTVQQLRTMALENGVPGYASLPKAQLIEQLEALVMVDELEDLEFERRYYSKAQLRLGVV